MTEIDLAAIRQRNEERRQRKEAATPGQWFLGRASDEPDTALVGAEGMIWIRIVGQPHRSSAYDGHFIAAARNDPVEADVDALLAEVERLREVIADMNANWPQGS